MKSKIIISFLILALISFSKPVFAKDATPSSKGVINQIKQEIKNDKQEIKIEKKEIKQEIKSKKAQAIFNVVKMGLNKRHQALLKIKAKLEARMAKNPMNKDLAKAKIELANFDAAEAKYQADLKALDTKSNKEVRGSVNLLRQDLNNIKKVLRNTTVALAQAPKLEVTKTQ
ncbi:MAG: hypothetical protein WCG91_02975 [Candidatus Shapirobacteria bacterium]